MELCEQHYQKLQEILTASEEIYGYIPHNRKILSDHRKLNKPIDTSNRVTDSESSGPEA